MHEQSREDHVNKKSFPKFNLVTYGFSSSNGLRIRGWRANFTSTKLFIFGSQNISYSHFAHIRDQNSAFILNLTKIGIIEYL